MNVLHERTHHFVINLKGEVTLLNRSHIESFIRGWKRKEIELTSVQISYNHNTKQGFMYSKGYSYPDVEEKMYDTLRMELNSFVEQVFRPMVKFLKTSLRIHLEVDADGMIDKNISIIADLNVNKKKYGGVYEFLRNVIKPYIYLADFIEYVEIMGNNNMMGRLSVAMKVNITKLSELMNKEWGEREQRLHKQWMLEMARVIDYCESEYRFAHILPVRDGEIFFEKHFEHMGMKIYFDTEEQDEITETETKKDGIYSY